MQAPKAALLATTLLGCKPDVPPSDWSQAVGFDSSAQCSSESDLLDYQLSRKGLPERDSDELDALLSANGYYGITFVSEATRQNLANISERADLDGVKNIYTRAAQDTIGQTLIVEYHNQLPWFPINPESNAEGYACDDGTSVYGQRESNSNFGPYLLVSDCDLDEEKCRFDFYALCSFQGDVNRLALEDQGCHLVASTNWVNGGLTCHHVGGEGFGTYDEACELDAGADSH